MISSGGDSAETFWRNIITLPSGTDTTNSSNQVSDFGVDKDGNIYVTGTRDDNSGPLNGYILKINPLGEIIEKTDLSNSATTLGTFGIAVDDDSNVYTYYGYGRLSKFNSSLVNQYHRESKWGGGQVFGEGLSGNGSLFVNGTNLSVYGNQGTSIYLGLTFDTTTGNCISGGYNYRNSGTASLLYYGANKPPGSGTIYLSGYCTDGSDPYWSIGTLGYGINNSMKFYIGQSNGAAKAVTRDSDGKLYVAGHMNNVPTLCKVDSFNNSLNDQGTAWWRKMNVSGQYNDLTADTWGNIYGAIGGMVVKYNSSGTLVWTKQITSSIHKIEIIHNILYGIGTASNTEIVVFKISLTGEGFSDQPSWTDYSFAYTNQGGTSGFATQGDLGGVANGQNVWGGFTNSSLSITATSPTFTDSLVDKTIPHGEEEWTTPGSYTWICPAGVNQVSAVAIGAGGMGGADGGNGGAGGGGALGWKNYIPVTPGQSYAVEVGDIAAGQSGNDGSDSYFINPSTVKGGGGSGSGGSASGGAGGQYTGDSGGAGGTGGGAGGGTYEGGGGGAGGYSGHGGNGGYGDGSTPPSSMPAGAARKGLDGQGGAGGGGGYGGSYTGGGVDIYGEGASGEGGEYQSGGSTGSLFGAGGSGSRGIGRTQTVDYGAGSAGATGSGGSTSGHGGHGAVRIIWGSGRAFPWYAAKLPVQGQQAYTTPGTYSWTAPSGVTSVSVVCVGGGGGGQASAQAYNGVSACGGAGGGLGWRNNIYVTPGETYTVVVGSGGNGIPGGSGAPGSNATKNGSDSYFINAQTVKGGGGNSADRTQNSVGGNYVGDGGGNGGKGNIGSGYAGGGGGGAGGYSGDGGDSVAPAPGTTGTPGNDGQGGAGGSGGGSVTGNYQYYDIAGAGSGGGGVGILGEGASGAGGAGGRTNTSYGTGNAGGGGSGGQQGSGVGLGYQGQRLGATYGGGGGGGGSQFSAEPYHAYNGADGGNGAVRIIWGSGRAFPATNTADV